MPYDKAYWENLWTKTLRDHADKVAQRPPNLHLQQAASALPPGRALDAGCGHGAETLWLAAQGWQVTAVDFSASALDHGRSRARALGPTIAERVTWLEADLGSWVPPAGQFDLVTCVYVHVAGAVTELVERLATGVAPAGQLLLVGHRPIDPVTLKPTPAAGQQQVSVEAATLALDAPNWRILVAEERARAVVGTGVDAVVLAQRARPQT